MNSREYTTLCLLIILAAIACLYYSKREKSEDHSADLHLVYHMDEARVFRNQFVSVSQGSSPNNDSVDAHMDLTTIPLYDPTGEHVGILESTASLFENRDGSSDVFQSLNYVLKDGVISTRVYFRNDKKNIFPNESMFQMPVVSGTGAYAHSLGTVDVEINADGSRNLTIHFH